MILLTGVAGGIGRLLTPSLLKMDDVIGIYNKNIPPFFTEKNFLSEQFDITNQNEINDFVARYKKRLNNLTILHLATISIDGLAMTYKEDDWDQTMNVNLKSNFLLTKSLLPLMIQQKWGRIIHVSSHVGFNGVVGTIAYGTSKMGLMGLSKTIAKEYGQFGITSNLLSLGYFEAGLFDRLPEKKIKKLIDEIPSKKFGDIESIANAIRFIISSDYVNGAVINIDGGL